jgi:hypothetical protein
MYQLLVSLVRKRAFFEQLDNQLQLEPVLELVVEHEARILALWITLSQKNEFSFVLKWQKNLCGIIDITA